MALTPPHNFAADMNIYPAFSLDEATGKDVSRHSGSDSGYYDDELREDDIGHSLQITFNMLTTVISTSFSAKQQHRIGVTPSSHAPEEKLKL